MTNEINPWFGLRTARNASHLVVPEAARKATTKTEVVVKKPRRKRVKKEAPTSQPLVQKPRAIDTDFIEPDLSEVFDYDDFMPFGESRVIKSSGQDNHEPAPSDLEVGTSNLAEPPSYVSFFDAEQINETNTRR